MGKIKIPDFKHKYHLLLDLMDRVPDVIYFKDTKGKFVMVNQAHAKGLGLKPQDLIGKSDFDLFPKERAESMTKDDLYVIRNGKPIIDKIERATRPDGEDNYVSTTKIPRFDKQGRVIGLMGITRDITHRMHLERIKNEKERIEKKLQLLEGVSKVKSDFVAVLSHELRTPLAIANESLRQIYEEPPGLTDQRQRKLLSMTKNNLERLGRLIDNLLDMSRVERHKLRLHYSLVNFNDLATGNSAYFRKLAQGKHITLKYSLPPEQTNIFVDAERITQVITNLLNNAIKFTEQNGEIALEVKILENKIRVAVIDTGVGIAKDDLKKLFSRFIQVSSFMESAGKGLGLGLSISKELVELHGGEIWVESTPGVGSKFYFTLPKIYSFHMLDKRNREKINHLLSHTLSVYLINISIIHFNEFKRILKLKHENFFRDLRRIIKIVLDELPNKQERKPPLILQDTRYGITSIIFPESDDKETSKLCDTLRNRIKNYFAALKGENIFINLGIISYPEHAKVSPPVHLSANINIRKIIIGAESRRHKRTNYKANIEILHAQENRELSETVDISASGICFISRIALETDSEVTIRLRERLQGKPLSLRGRIAWRKDLPESGKYIIGLEFTELGDKKRRIEKLARSASFT